MKKISTMVIEGMQIFKENQLTIGLDLGDRTSHYGMLDEADQVIWEQELPTTPKGFEQVFSKIPRSRIALETGTHSPWISRQLSPLGPEVIVAHARKVRLISASSRKDDRLDARTLARLARIDPALLGAASQCQSTNPSDRDPGGASQRSHRAGKCGPRVNEILWRTTAEMRDRTDEWGD
jgi:transposase